MTLSKIPHHLLKRYPLGYNYIINGNFDIWQRGTSQTSAGFGSDDYWINFNVGSTKTHSRQSFIFGEVFPDGKPCPKYYSRTVVNSVAGAGNYVIKQATIPEVSRLAGKTARLVFYARANANKSMAVEFIQKWDETSNFLTPLVKKIQLTTTWTRFSIPVKFNSLSDKIIDASGRDKVGVGFWFDAGSNWNSRTDSLGQQSGTFDIACVSLVEGDHDIPVLPRSYAEEFRLCTTQYEIVIVVLQRFTTVGNWGGSGPMTYLFKTRKYVSPGMVMYADLAKTQPNQLTISGGGLISVSTILTGLTTERLTVWNNTGLPTVGQHAYAWAHIEAGF